MENASWLIQVYQMSDMPAQTSAADLLSSVGSLTVDARTCDRGAFLVVECSEITDALNVYELVMTIDSDAELIHSIASSSEARTTARSDRTLQDA